MPRDPKKLRVFLMADELIPRIYAVTRTFPPEEKFGLVSQMRRAAISVAANIVEGCARRKTNDYLHFMSIATGSAYELGYLIGLSSRLNLMMQNEADTLAAKAGHIAASLTALVESLELAEREAQSANNPQRAKSPKPTA